MRLFQQNKLWRDKAVALMEQHGSIMHWYRLSDIEFNEQLRLKLIEETEEVVHAQTAETLKAELADVLEVIDALCALHNIEKSEVIALQEKKRASRGGFTERKFITIAEHPEGTFGEQYCLADPTKYPEITK